MLSLASSQHPSFTTFLSSPPPSSKTRFLSPPHNQTLRLATVSCSRQPQNAASRCAPKDHRKWVATLLGAGVGLALVGPAMAAQSPLLDLSEPLGALSLELTEPANALSLPTWAIHVSSVVEWIIAMALVWQYGQKPGNESWKGLSWGMVPLLGGAMCACTWHFFYNSESLEALVVLQAALTVIGNATMCIAAFRIYKSQSQSENV